MARSVYHRKLKQNKGRRAFCKKKNHEVREIMKARE